MLRISLMDLSVVGQFLSPSTLDGSGLIVFLFSSRPRYSTCCFSNLHFSGLKNKDASHNMERTVCTTSRW